MSLLLASSRGPFASFTFDLFRGAKDEHLTHPNQAKGLAVTFKLSKISSIEKEGNPLKVLPTKSRPALEIAKALVIVAQPYRKCKQKEFDQFFPLQHHQLCSIMCEYTTA